MSHFAITMMLWIVPIILQLMIAGFMWRSGSFKDLPLFFSYSCFVPLRDLCLLGLQGRTTPYFWTYWIGEAIAVLLGILIIYEVLNSLSQDHPALRRLGIRLFQLVLIVGVFLSLVLWWQRANPANGSLLGDIILSAERSLRVLQVALLLMILTLVSKFGLTWNKYVVGIVVGFGVAAGLDLSVLELRDLNLLGDAPLIFLRSLEFLLATLVWAFYFIPARDRDKSIAVSGLPDPDLQSWTQSLQHLMERK